MINLKNLLTKPIQQERLPKWVFVAVFVIAILGFADASYLTIEHYSNSIPPCTIGGCESVLTSQYSNILGVPVSLFGAIYYLFIIVMLFIYRDSKKEIFLRIPLLASILGFIASLGLMYIMFFVIKSFCQYCFLSALSSTAIFIISYYVIYKNSKN